MIFDDQPDYEDQEHSSEEDQLPRAVQDMLEGNKRKEFDDLCPKQKKRRIQELVEVIDFTAHQFKMSTEDVIESLVDAHDFHSLEEDHLSITPAEALKLKDEILLSDWAYQQLRNCSSNFPPLTKVKAERLRVNQHIKELFQVAESAGKASCSVIKVLQLISEKYNTSTFKLTFDHRKNEERDEVLLALIPTCISHSPNMVYPVVMYVGKEEEILDKAGDCFREVNLAIKNFNIQIMISTDLKSFWTMTELRFKFATDQFCPYCHCQKCEIEEVLRGKKKPKEREGTFGPLLIPLNKFVYCFLHAKMRMTETILRHQIKGYYSRATNQQKALAEFETVLRGKVSCLFVCLFVFTRSCCMFFEVMVAPATKPSDEFFSKNETSTTHLF